MRSGIDDAVQRVSLRPAHSTDRHDTLFVRTLSVSRRVTRLRSSSPFFPAPRVCSRRRRLREVAESNGERLLESRGNTISFAITLDALMREVWWVGVGSTGDACVLPSPSRRLVCCGPR